MKYTTIRIDGHDVFLYDKDKQLIQHIYLDEPLIKEMIRRTYGYEKDD